MSRSAIITGHIDQRWHDGRSHVVLVFSRAGPVRRRRPSWRLAVWFLGLLFAGCGGGLL